MTEKESKHTVLLDGDTSELIRALAEIRRDNEREYGETFSTPAVAERMGVSAEYLEQLESGKQPLAQDLTELTKALHIRLTVTAKTAVQKEDDND